MISFILRNKKLRLQQFVGALLLIGTLSLPNGSEGLKCYECGDGAEGERHHKWRMQYLNDYTLPPFPPCSTPTIIEDCSNGACMLSTGVEVGGQAALCQGTLEDNVMRGEDDGCDKDGYCYCTQDFCNKDMETSKAAVRDIILECYVCGEGNVGDAASNFNVKVREVTGAPFKRMHPCSDPEIVKHPKLCGKQSACLFSDGGDKGNAGLCVDKSEKTHDGCKKDDKGIVHCFCETDHCNKDKETVLASLATTTTTTTTEPPKVTSTEEAAASGNSTAASGPGSGNGTGSSGGTAGPPTGPGSTGHATTPNAKLLFSILLAPQIFYGYLRGHTAAFQG